MVSIKNNRKWVLALIALLLGGAAWWRLGNPAPSPKIPHVSRKPPSATSVTAASPSQPDVTLTADTSTQRKFENMGVLERNAILEEIRKQDLNTIFQMMLDADHLEHDPMKRSAIQTTLAYALREQPENLKFYEKLRQFIENDSNTKQERAQLIGVIAFAATDKSAEILLHEAQSLSDKDLKKLASEQVKQLGDQAANEDPSSSLNQVWQKSGDQNLLIYTAESMAKIGAPSSIELLLTAALSPDGQDNVRKPAAEGALKEVYTKNAVPPLASLLTNSQIGDPANTLAFNTLRQIGDGAAVQALMNWLQNSDDRAAPMATQWIAHAKAPTQLKAAEAALDPATPFRSEANREALREGLAEYNRTHFSTPAGVPLSRNPQPAQ